MNGANRIQWRTLALCVVILYLVAAHFAFALRHPELTDTQRMLRIVDALLWR